MPRLDNEIQESTEQAASESGSPDYGGDRATGPDTRPLRCERCSGRVRVHVLEGYVEGKPVYQHLCLDCADAAYSRYLTGGSAHARARPHLSSILIVAGLLLAVLGGTADLFGVEGHAGFGWKQQVGLAVGALFVILGALLRVDGLAVCGVILVGIGTLADVRGLVGSPGVGWRQGVVILVGLALILTGLHARNRRLRRRLPDAA